MPSRLHKPLSYWTAEDVQALVDAQIEEGQQLDYKRELKFEPKSERLELAKDASGMGNAIGGLLVYGVDEKELPDGRRLPAGPTPLAEGDAQARLEDILHSAVSPPLNLSAATLEAPSGGYFVVVRIQQRAGPLHMVEAYGQHRYFIRSGLATRPMGAHEVERAFAELGGREERIAVLLCELPLVPRIDTSRDWRKEQLHDREREPGCTPWTSVVMVPLDRSGRMLPMRTPGAAHDFSFDEAASKFISGHPGYVVSGAYAVDAWGYLRDDEDGHGNLTGRLRLYEAGVCEWGRRYGSNLAQIPTQAIVEHIHDALAYFATVYRRVDYFGRLRVWVRIDNADSAEFKVDPRYSGEPTQPTIHAVSFGADTSVEALLDDAMPLVHEAMDAIWRGFGLPRASLFSPEGEFLKRRR